MRVTYEEFLEQLAALPLTWEIKNGEIKSQQGTESCCPWLAVARKACLDDEGNTVGRFNVQNGSDWRNRDIWEAADGKTDDYVRQDLLKACRLV